MLDETGFSRARNGIGAPGNAGEGESASRGASERTGRRRGLDFFPSPL